jgi:hypothetical protein
MVRTEPPRRSVHGRIPVKAWATSDAASATAEPSSLAAAIQPEQERSRAWGVNRSVVARGQRRPVGRVPMGVSERELLVVG